MDKETSAQVSSIASEILHTTAPITAGPDTGGMQFIERRLYDDLLAKAKTLAGSALSQDETPGRQPTTFLDRLKMEHAHLSGALDALTIFIGRDMPGASPHQRDLLTVQHSAMTVYLRVLQMRLTNLENDNG